MARNPRHDILFEPVQVGPKVLRNRFWQTPHSIAAGSDFPGFQAAYRGTKAEGGWAAVFVEATAVSVDADVDPLTIVRLRDEGDVRNLRLTTDAIHEHGSLAVSFESVYSGHRLAREIDSADPSRPVSYVRERRLVASTEADFRLGSPTLSYDWPAPTRHPTGSIR